MCGKTLEEGIEKPLIDVEDLKHLDIFEAVILVIREMPIKTKLLPDYKIDWGYKSVEKEIPERKPNNIQIFKY